MTVHTPLPIAGGIYAKNIIVGGGSGAASSNLAATNSKLSANISLLLTSVQAADCNWRYPPPHLKALLTPRIAFSNTHPLFFHPSS